MIVENENNHPRKVTSRITLHNPKHLGMSTFSDTPPNELGFRGQLTRDGSIGEPGKGPPTRSEPASGAFIPRPGYPESLNPPESAGRSREAVLRRSRGWQSMSQTRNVRARVVRDRPFPRANSVDGRAQHTGIARFSSRWSPDTPSSTRPRGTSWHSEVLVSVDKAD